MPAEFDDYAANYQAQLRDPIRDSFASGPLFFVQRKWLLLHGFLNRHGIRTETRRWLDVGCGQGDLLRLGRPFFGEVAGCDVSSEMVAEARDLDVRVQQGPDELPYQSGEFDMVTAVCVYHHVVAGEMRRTLTNEIKRVLKPGGMFCIIEHNPFNPATRIIVRRLPMDATARLLKLSESCALLTGAGFRVVEKVYFLYLPERLYRKAAFVETCLKKVPMGGQYAVFGIA